MTGEQGEPTNRAGAWLTSGAIVAAIAGVAVLLLTSQRPRHAGPTRASTAVPASASAALGLAVAPGGSLSAAPLGSQSGPPGPKTNPASEQEKREPEPRQAYVIAAIGDSLTDPKSHGGKYLAYVKERCPETRIDNFGKGADMVNQMRRRYLARIEPSPTPYSHLVVFGGVNDLYSDKTAGRTPEKIARDLTIMYSKARARGMKVVALTVAPWGGFTRYYNARRGQNTLKLNRWIEAQFDAGAVQHVIDAYSLLSCGRPEYLCRDYSIDGIHFNAKGHAVLGQALYEEAFRNCK